MKTAALFSALLIAVFMQAQTKKPCFFAGAGIDYRQYPIDIEDVPRGPLPHDNGLPPDDGKFWQTFSLHGRAGIRLKSNWSVSLAAYTRYNLLHRTESMNYNDPPPKGPGEKKNFKYDIFLDAEKRIRVKKSKERYLFMLAGLGFTNINSRFNVVLTDTSIYGPFPPHHYQGSHVRFTPRVSIGFQYAQLRLSLDAYVIEDPILANLTSLWLGAAIGFEFKKKEKNKPIKHPNQTRPGF